MGDRRRLDDDRQPEPQLPLRGRSEIGHDTICRKRCRLSGTSLSVLIRTQKWEPYRIGTVALERSRFPRASPPPLPPPLVDRAARETYDTEIGAAVVDDARATSADGVAVSALALRTRCALWSGHVGLSAAEVCARTLADGVAAWVAAAAEGSRVARYAPEETWAYWALRKAIDPDGTCSFDAEGEDAPVGGEDANWTAAAAASTWTGLRED